MRVNLQKLSCCSDDDLILAVHHQAIGLPYAQIHNGPFATVLSHSHQLVVASRSVARREVHRFRTVGRQAKRRRKTRGERNACGLAGRCLVQGVTCGVENVATAVRGQPLRKARVHQWLDVGDFHARNRCEICAIQIHAHRQFRVTRRQFGFECLQITCGVWPHMQVVVEAPLNTTACHQHLEITTVRREPLAQVEGYIPVSARQGRHGQRHLVSNSAGRCHCRRQGRVQPQNLFLRASNQRIQTAVR